MDGGLSERKEKEDCGEGLCLRLEGCEQWSAAKSISAPIMFLIYVNDLVDGIGSYANLFADNVKIMKRCVHNFKAKIDRERYGDETSRV